ncbi:transferase family-domain-containing protein [Aspergillus karnatakaensis]|uniref:transferase family-domain-containing protein n=1 Tax=Aspergillus karnatakaensis TaxID=1810916 RepID=UPI003CCE04F0
MPLQQTHHLHPQGWESSPEEERFKVTTLDYLSVCSYNMYALFFRLDTDNESNIQQAISILKAGLERTLSQTRHLCGTIEKDPEGAGGHSFVTKRGSTVRFIVQWLTTLNPDSKADEEGEGEGERERYPSFHDIEAAHFSAPALKPNLSLYAVPPMTYGVTEAAHPDNHPVVAAYKANIVDGGIVFAMHHHHYANDVLGWAGMTHQFAENCYAVAHNTAYPGWDGRNLDLGRFIKSPTANEMVDAPASPGRHPEHRDAISLLFHLPKSRAAELKRIAAPEDGSGRWVSTYDAFSAFMMRVLTRVRVEAGVFKVEESGPILWAEAVDMRRRLHNPSAPARMQGNVMMAVVNASTETAVPHPTVSEIISEWPLWKLALYVRALTNTASQEALDQSLNAIANIRDKTKLSIRIDSTPPLSILQTDHREVNITAADFGFAKPVAYRFLADSVANGIVFVYPPRASDDPDEGLGMAIAFEKDLAQSLIEDEEWRAYFEYRGVDAVNASPEP